MTLEDRPASLRRSTPRPSPVENIDPIDTTPVPAPTEAPPATPGDASETKPEAKAAPAPTAAAKPAAKKPAARKPKSTSPVSKPAAGEGDTETAPEAPAAETSVPTRSWTRGTREQEIVVQLNSRISLKARDTLDQIIQYDGRTIRADLETGIYLLSYLVEREKTGEVPVLEELLAIYAADA